MATSAQSGSNYLVTYRPLVWTAHGRQASQHHDLLPFIDGSIRREPDLEYESPTISAICRGAMFAPRLRVGDVAIYLTVKGRWVTGLPNHHRLTAVLRVSHRFDSHLDAAMWFRDSGRVLPSNCMVPENPPEPLDHSTGLVPKPPCGKQEQGYLDWDRKYSIRVRRHGAFLVCEALFVNVSWSAPVIEDAVLLEAFGRIPPTRTPCHHPATEVNALLKGAGILLRI